MPNFVMLVGLPGSGKSTMRELLTCEDGLYTGAEVLSTDDILLNIAEARGTTYNDVFQDSIREATRFMNKRMQVLARAADTDVILDQTNMTRKSRAGKMQAFMGDEWSRHAFVISDPGEQELAVRLAARAGKTIPESVISNMRHSYEEPNRDEGFHTVTHIGQRALSKWMRCGSKGGEWPGSLLERSLF